MSNFYRLTLTYLTITFMLLLFSCRHTTPNHQIALEDKKAVVAEELSIDTFSTFPPEIDGCSCYLSNDSLEFNKAVYIYMNDYAQTSFLKINGVLTKFTQTDFKEIDNTTTIATAKSDNYIITIQVKFLKQSGYETHLNTGVIKLTNRKGRTISRTFYGECGC